MRRVGLAAISLSWTLAGGSCVPLFQSEPRDPAAAGRRFAVAISQPATNRTVSRGQIVPIAWSASNLTGQTVVATLLVEATADGSQTILRGGILFGEPSVSETFDWDTTPFARGEYRIIMRAELDGTFREHTAGGRVTLNEPPTFRFTEPTSDQTLGADPEDRVMIRWTAGDPEGDGTVEIVLDPDTDHDSGNEFVLVSRELPETAGGDSLNWDGKDKDQTRVPPNTYNLLARVDDGAIEPRIIESNVRITVEQAEDIRLAVTQPAEDVTFTIGGDPLTIEFTLNESDDVLIDLKIDTDDNHSNGNEQTILAQRLVSETTHRDTFAWNGSDANGATVPAGIYRIFIVVSRASGEPATAEARGLVFRRNETAQPLIGLLEPAAPVTVNFGQFVTIRWRDDDPGDARIRLRIDDDATPNQPTETGDPEITILSDRPAPADGVQDTFTYQIPSTLEPGTYFVFAYIDRDNSGDPDQISVAPGRIIVRDPASTQPAGSTP